MIKQRWGRGPMTDKVKRVMKRTGAAIASAAIAYQVCLSVNLRAQAPIVAIAVGIWACVIADLIHDAFGP
jgi:hypothetical protein